jgi:acetyltransferase
VTDILARAQAVRPGAFIRGVTIHPMIVKPKAQELIVGIADDPTFGPIIAFGPIASAKKEGVEHCYRGWRG